GRGTRREVVDAVVRGCVVPFALDRRQRLAFAADSDGRIALDVVRHMLHARAVVGADCRRFPISEAVFQAIADRLGERLGIKRCPGLIRRLQSEGVLLRAGHYRQPYRRGRTVMYLVALYKPPDSSSTSPSAGAAPAPTVERPNGRRLPRKRPRERVRWWQTPFAGPEGRPPPGFRMAAARRTRSLDELAL